MVAGAIRLALGDQHSMILKEDGTVWSTGANIYGQLGEGSTGDDFKFVGSFLKETKAVAAGSSHSIAVKQNGSVWTTGSHYFGPLWDEATSNRSKLTKVIDTGVVAIAAGDYHSMVLKKDGSVWATGWNGYGQLGDGSRRDRTTYARITGLFDMFSFYWLSPFSLLTQFLLDCTNRFDRGIVRGEFRI